MHQLSSSRDVSFRDLPCDVRGSGSEQFRFSSCASTWRECQPGDLFIAITRADSDGHDDVDEARRRGAVAVLAERYLPTDLPVFLTEDTREAYGHICHALAGHPTREMHGIGIAGTSGKTSTARHLNAILRAAGRLSVSATDERWFDPQPMESRPVTTAPRIVAGLSDAAACGYQHAVLELHSPHLARRVWSGTELDTLVLTNATADFRGLHNSADNHRRAVLRSLGLLKPHGMVIVNADDAALRSWLETCEMPAISYGLKHDATIEGEILEETPYDQLLIVHAGCESAPIRLARPGRHNASNALAAIATGLSLGIDLATMARALELSSPAERVLEPLQLDPDYPRVFVDRGTLPDRLRTTLSTIRRTTTGKLWVVYETPADLAKDHRPAVGTLLERYASHAALCVHASIGHRALNTLHDLLDGYEDSGRDCVAVRLEQAIDWVCQRVAPGDALVVVGETPHAGQLVQEALAARHADFEAAGNLAAVLPFAPTNASVEAPPKILKFEDFRRSA